MSATMEVNEASLKSAGGDRGGAVKQDIRKTVVLGAGTMGAQVAAHLITAGIDVVLLDIVPKGLGEGEDRSGLARNTEFAVGECH